MPVFSKESWKLESLQNLLFTHGLRLVPGHLVRLVLEQLVASGPSSLPAVRAVAWKDHIDRRTGRKTLPHQAGIELLDFHARVWKSDQGGRNSMQEMHGNQTKCMEFRPIKENSNFWTSIFCPGINFSCSKSLWIWWTIDPLILACLKLMTYASFSTKELLAVLMDGNPCTNGWNSMHQNRKNVIASCFFEQSCLRQVKIQDPWQI